MVCVARGAGQSAWLQRFGKASEPRSRAVRIETSERWRKGFQGRGYSMSQCLDLGINFIYMKDRRPGMSRKLELECGGKCTQDYLSNWVQNAEFCYTD